MEAITILTIVFQKICFLCYVKEDESTIRLFTLFCELGTTSNGWLALLHKLHIVGISWSYFLFVKHP